MSVFYKTLHQKSSKITAASGNSNSTRSSGRGELKIFENMQICSLNNSHELSHMKVEKNLDSCVYPFSIKATLHQQLPSSFILRSFSFYTPHLNLPFLLHHLILGFPECHQQQPTPSPYSSPLCFGSFPTYFPSSLGPALGSPGNEIPMHLGFSASARKRPHVLRAILHHSALTG